MTRPNVLYIVIDSLRADAIDSADAISSLADRNVSFEEAITPATWSLPAHVSLLSGRYPHEHGVTKSGDESSDLPLVEALNDRGYTTYGVSGNPFFSQSQGFDTAFDRFWYTSRMWFPEGIDVSNYHDDLAEVIYGSGSERARRLWRFAKDVLSRPHRLKSFGNIAYAAALQLNPVDRLNLDGWGLGDVPHSLVDNSLAYRPETNTAIIEDVLKQEAESDTPFFLFTNYMDTHHPYNPPEEFRAHLDSIEDWADVRDVNDRLSTWEFTKGDVDDDLLATLRELYHGEVRAVDRHIQRLLETLEAFDLRRETVVIVTADHGENLGESDHRERRRIGHLASLSEALVRVPLVIAHPAAGGETVREPVSTKDVASAIIEGELFGEDGVDASAVLPEDGVVLCEAPAKGGTEALMDNHPEAPIDIVEEETVEDNVLGRVGDWRAIRSSTGASWGWREDDPVEYASCPQRLRDTVEDALEGLIAQESGGTLSDSAINRLEDLGYV